MFRKNVFLSLILLSVNLLVGCSPGGPEKISVTTTEFMFDPMSWTVPAGEQVELTLKNEGVLDHEWVILKKGMQVTLPFDEDDEEKYIGKWKQGAVRPRRILSLPQPKQEPIPLSAVHRLTWNRA